MQLTDYYLIKLDSKYEATFGETKILRPAISERIADEYDKGSGQGGMNCLYNPEFSKRKHGSVLQIPNKLSTLPIAPKLPGAPIPQPYVSGEACEKYGLGKNGYEPYTYEPEFHTVHDLYKVGCNVGDKIFFYHDAFDYEKPVLGEDIYAVHVKDVVAYMSNGVIKAAHGFVIGQKVVKEVQIGSFVEFNQDPNKKNTLSAVYVSDQSEVSVSDVFMHVNNADYPIEIEGIEMFVVREKDILCLICYTGP